MVYDGTVKLTLPLTFGQAAGDLTLDVVVRYQACSATDCQPPGEIRFALPVTVLNHVERPG